MVKESEYDVAIVGGGLAGLAASILLSRQGHSVILFEKETYPFQRVCGEYISLESWDFVQGLGLPLQELSLPVIDTLLLTAPNGKEFTTTLPLGGFGISRYMLDHRLSLLAKEAGVRLLENSKVDTIKFDTSFSIHATNNIYKAKVCCAAWGKRSNIDVKWNRSFLQKPDTRLNNFVGIKYHVKGLRAKNIIGLHNFKDGYCGISKVEEDKYCLCYMTKAGSLKSNNNDVSLMERNILFKNPHLKKIFEESEFVKNFPVTISQISFSPKTKFENGVLMLGDSAGMITPLCGNGMSIALHTGKIAAVHIHDFLTGIISREEMELRYTSQWKNLFERRLAVGRIIQRFFGSNTLSNFFVSLFKTAPFLASPIIRKTHGQPF